MYCNSLHRSHIKPPQGSSKKWYMLPHGHVFELDIFSMNSRHWDSFSSKIWHVRLSSLPEPQWSRSCLAKEFSLPHRRWLRARKDVILYIYMYYVYIYIYNRYKQFTCIIVVYVVYTLLLYMTCYVYIYIHISTTFDSPRRSWSMAWRLSKSAPRPCPHCRWGPSNAWATPIARAAWPMTGGPFAGPVELIRHHGVRSEKWGSQQRVLDCCFDSRSFYPMEMFYPFF